MNLLVIEKIDEWVSRKSTGTPKELAERLSLSERMVYNYIKFMKAELKAPIRYSRVRRSYYYEEGGFFEFRWKPKKESEKQVISD